MNQHETLVPPPVGWTLHFVVPGALEDTPAWRATCIDAARRLWGRRAAVEGPATMRVRALFPRPPRLLARHRRGRNPLPFVGKPDVQDAMGLPLDALVRAGVLSSRDHVAYAEIEREFVPLDHEGDLPVAPTTSIWLAPARCP